MSDPIFSTVMARAEDASVAISAEFIEQIVAKIQEAINEVPTSQKADVGHELLVWLFVHETQIRLAQDLIASMDTFD